MEGQGHSDKGHYPPFKRAAGLGYTPGGPVKQPCVPAKTKTNTVIKRRKDRAALDLPSECILHIASHLVQAKQDLSVILMSMVNKQYWQTIGNDAQLWYNMYMHWRGPITPSPQRVSMMGRGVVRLMPSIPRTLPNFRDLGMSIA